MALFQKPQFNSVWASTGTKLTPINSKISQGWVVEIPPHEFENWMQNRQDAMLAHINQVGIVLWDNTVEYQANKSYVQGTTTGTVYLCVRTGTNRNPELGNVEDWVVAFESKGAALLKANNLSDVPDKAAARANLGIPDPSVSDGRYLISANNLADVPNKASGRNNLGLGGSATLNVGAVAGTVAAGDDPRIVDAASKFSTVSGVGGLTGSGFLYNSPVISMGTPSTITATSSNSVGSGTHSHAIAIGTLLPNSWSNYSRALGTPYTNNLSKPIIVSVIAEDNYSTGFAFQLFISGVEVSRAPLIPPSSARGTVSGWVPPGATYQVNLGALSNFGTIISWAECR